VIVHGKKATTALATILWAHVHGLACLLLDGPLGLQFESESDRTQYLWAVGEQFADLMMAKESG
jgi:hypothetical protein